MQGVRSAKLQWGPGASLLRRTRVFQTGVLEGPWGPAQATFLSSRRLIQLLQACTERRKVCAQSPPLILGWEPPGLGCVQLLQP